MLQGCSQFIVEFAGDWLTQNRDPDGNNTPDEQADLESANYGAVTAIAPDNVIDFVPATRGVWAAGTAYVAGDVVIDATIPNPLFYVALRPSTNIVPNSSAADWAVTAAPRVTRWYGMPRDVRGGPGGTPDGSILARPQLPNVRGPAAPNMNTDVVPLADVIWSANFAVPADLFEREVPWTSTLPAIEPPDDYIKGPRSMAPIDRYLAAWGPDTAAYQTPQMLRFVISVEDPRGRLAEPQTFEYVVELP
jgi:hypothetical protein